MQRKLMLKRFDTHNRRDPAGWLNEKIRVLR